MKKRRNKVTVIFMAAVFAVAAVPGGARALTMTTNAGYYVDEYPPSPPFLEEDADSKSADSGAIKSEVSSPTYGGTASSFAGEGGGYAVHAEYGSGSVKSYGFWAKAASSVVIANTLSAPAMYNLSFQIPEVTLGIWDYCNCYGLVQHSEYSVAFSIDGVTIWESSAALSGGKADGYTLTQSGDIVLSSSPDGWYDRLYKSAPYSGALALGTLAPGASFTLGYEMTVKVNGADFETGAIASVGDPLNLSSTAAFSVSGTAAPVPEPSTFLLLGSGLAGLGLAGRRFMSRAS